MFGSEIGRRVWKAIKAKIAAAQKEYDKGCENADVQCRREIVLAEIRREDVKRELADSLVRQIIG